MADGEPRRQTTSSCRRPGTFGAAVLAACLNGIAVGNLAGWPQAAIPQLLSPDQYKPAFTESDAAWIAGIFFPGMLVGGFVSLYVAATFGKRKLFLLASLPLTIGWSIIAVAASFWQLMFGRLILGLSGGMMCNQTEMYLSEISPSRLRSSMSAVFCASVHTGVLVSFAVGPCLSVSTAPAVYLAVVLLLAGMYLVAAPETPFWLLRQARSDEALSSLRKLRGRADVHRELQEIAEFVDRSVVSDKHDDGFTKKLKRVMRDAASRKAILLVVLLTTAQQFSGMAAMHSYAQLIFERSVSVIPGRYVSLLLGLIELVCTLASGCVVERVGRRPLVTWSCLLCTGCMALLGLHFHLSSSSGSSDIISPLLPLVCIVVFAFAYGIGLATMATVFAAESLSMDARNLGAAVQNTTVCTSIFVITKLWQVISSTYGQQYSFWTASLITGVHAMLLLIALPETRGRTLTEIQRLLAFGKSGACLAPLSPAAAASCKVTIAPGATTTSAAKIAAGDDVEMRDYA